MRSKRAPLIERVLIACGIIATVSTGCRPKDGHSSYSPQHGMGHAQVPTAPVPDPTLIAELRKVQLMIQHVSSFTSGKSNALYRVITRQVNFYYDSYKAA